MTDSGEWAVLDGNEAAARVAHTLSEVIAIYPITPSSAMAESADEWSSRGVANLWGEIPRVIEMQSEAGAAGTLHGALTKGVLGTTFTASQGLLLMLPNMYKIAGELTPTVIHVAARTLATHALSIFGDHSDVMSARMTGFAMLSSSSVQTAQDFALVSHAATLRSRIPFLHFFDGFRTSHEVNKIQLVSRETMRAMIREEDVLAHRARGLTPDAPMLRGTAQNPDVFFQAREASNPFYLTVPDVVQECFDELAALTGRQYSLVEYYGDPAAERVIVVMGSAWGTVREGVDLLRAKGEKVGAVVVRMYRPFPTEQFLAALPKSVRSIAVLDRTKEPGAPAEPLCMDVTHAVASAAGTGVFERFPLLIGGRYGLSSKEFTPAMVAAVYAELEADNPRRSFTVGINDDVTRLSLPIDPAIRHESDAIGAVFFGLGADGTVGASKNSVKIIGGEEGRYAQGYFVYDSRKSGATTISHLRFGDSPIRSSYLIDEADFVAVHQFELLSSMRTLDIAKTGAKVLINSSYGSDTWEHLPREIQDIIIERQLDVWVIDAAQVAEQARLGKRINTVMQPCFFYLSGVVPQDQAITKIKESVEKTYGLRGRTIVERNFAAIDAAIDSLVQLAIPDAVSSDVNRMVPVPDHAPDFVKQVTAMMLRGEGDLLPVSALPPDGTWPTATSQYEKRGIAERIPIWDPSLCIDCGKCAIVCPHAAIRIKLAPQDALEDAPEGFKSKSYRDRALLNHDLIVQVAPDDCTGCGVCVDVCPARSKSEVKHKAINMEPLPEHQERERENFEFFLGIPEIDRSAVRHDVVKGVAQLQPLFEFSGACAGCGETPYLRTLTQLYGDRLLVANATGCSSIYSGNLPTTPYTKNPENRGPAWSNSLFEDNAEFGLGLRLAYEQQRAAARRLVTELADQLPAELVDAILTADQSDEAGIEAQRARVLELLELLDSNVDPRAERLRSLANELVDKSVWIVGGDGWAYDIGYGGLNHVLATGANVNILVLDTEVYSNTGGQASTSTPRGASAKFASAGKASPKKDLGMIAQAYGNVYVAQVAMGANQQQVIKAFNEAAAWQGPSLIIAYSTCIAHGIDMETSMTHQAEAVSTGYWPLYRFRPDEEDAPALKLDSKAPTGSVADFMASEARFSILARSHPQRAEELRKLAEKDAEHRWEYYAQLAGLTRHQVGEIEEEGN